MKRNIVESYSIEEAFRALNNIKSEKMTIKEGWGVGNPKYISGDELRQAVAEQMEFILDKLGENITLDIAYKDFMELCAEANISFDRKELEAILRNEYGLTETFEKLNETNASKAEPKRATSTKIIEESGISDADRNLGLDRLFDAIIRRGLIDSQPDFEPIDSDVAFSGWVETLAGELFSEYFLDGKEFSGALLSKEDDAYLEDINNRVAKVANKLLGTSYKLVEEAKSSNAGKRVVESDKDPINYNMQINYDAGDYDNDGCDYVLSQVDGEWTYENITDDDISAVFSSAADAIIDAIRTFWGVGCEDLVDADVTIDVMLEETLRDVLDSAAMDKISAEVEALEKLPEISEANVVFIDNI